MTSRWQKMFGSRRAAIDRALLASMEREIAQAEKASTKAKDRPWNPDTAPVHQITEEERLRIARAFGRPL